MALVYMATSPSGKVYIGLTTRTLEERIKLHYRLMPKKPLRRFYKALAKYPPLDIEWEILVDNISLEKAKELEILFIERYNSFYTGYNSTKGGDGVLGLAISQKAIEANRTPEVAAKKSKAMKIIWASKSESEQKEWRDKLNAHTKDPLYREYLSESRKAFSVDQVTNIRILSLLGASVSDLAEWFNGGDKGIRNVREGRSNAYSDISAEWVYSITKDNSAAKDLSKKLMSDLRKNKDLTLDQMGNIRILAALGASPKDLSTWFLVTEAVVKNVVYMVCPAYGYAGDLSIPKKDRPKAGGFPYAKKNGSKILQRKKLVDLLMFLGTSNSDIRELLDITPKTLYGIKKSLYATD